MYAYAKSVIGKQPFNEDAFSVCMIKDYMFLAVADGNGGIVGSINTGKIAVNIVEQTMKKIIEHDPEISKEKLQEELLHAFYTTSVAYRTINAIDDRFAAVYASLCAVLIHRKTLDVIYASVGNIEFQLWRNQQFTRMNKLHTDAYDKVSNNILHEKDYYTDPGRGMLTSMLGLIETPKIDSRIGPLRNEDILFLASDGVFRFITPDDLIKTMANSNTPQQGVDRALDPINLQDGSDNATLIVCDVLADDK